MNKNLDTHTPTASTTIDDEHHNHHGRHHGHDHGNPFFVPFILILLFALIELVGGWYTQSLALLSDAWHMLTDVVALGLAMFAAHQAEKARATKTVTHVERWASIINALLMLVVIAWIIYEAIIRFNQPKVVAGAYVMFIAFVGLIVNLIVAHRLHHLATHHDGDKNLNQRAALLHVMGDLLGSISALVAGAVIYYTGWMTIDPILSILISVLLLGVTFNLIRDIMQQKPRTHHHHH